MSETDKKSGKEEFNKLVQKWTGLNMDCAASLQRSSDLVKTTMMDHEATLVGTNGRRVNDSVVAGSANTGHQNIDRNNCDNKSSRIMSTPKHDSAAGAIPRQIFFSNTSTAIRPVENQHSDTIRDSKSQISFDDLSQQENTGRDNFVDSYQQRSMRTDSKANGSYRMNRRWTISEPRPRIIIFSPRGNERHLKNSPSIESLNDKSRIAREHFSFEAKRRNSDPMTPTTSFVNLISRIGDSVTPTLEPRSGYHTPVSSNASNRKRKISVYSSTSVITPVTPIIKGPELAVIARKMGADLPERLYENEKSLSARRNSLGGVAPSVVQQSFDAGFIQAYKLIAWGIDEISHRRRSVDRDLNDKRSDTDFRTANLRNRATEAPSDKDPRVMNHSENTCLQQIMDNVLAPLEDVLNDPDAEGVEQRLDSIEAAISKANRGSSVDVSHGSNAAFERRTQSSLWELERQLRRGVNVFNQKLAEDVIRDQRNVDLKDLVQNIHELLDIYQTGITKLQTLDDRRSHLDLIN